MLWRALDESGGLAAGRKKRGQVSILSAFCLRHAAVVLTSAALLTCQLSVTFYERRQKKAWGFSIGEVCHI